MPLGPYEPARAYMYLDAARKCYDVTAPCTAVFGRFMTKMTEDGLVINSTVDEHLDSCHRPSQFFIARNKRLRRVYI